MEKEMAAKRQKNAAKRCDLPEAHTHASTHKKSRAVWITSERWDRSGVLAENRSSRA
jgi:hypothetical protein